MYPTGMVGVWDLLLEKQQISIVFSSLCKAACDVFLVSLVPVLSQAPHTDPDSPQQTIRTLCIKTRLWNEDSEFRERQTESERETGRESSLGICIVLVGEGKKHIGNAIERGKS